MWRATATPASISASTSNVTYPDIGPSVWDKIFRVTPGVVAGGVVCAEAPVAINSASPQIAQPATPVKYLRVSMAASSRPRSIDARATKRSIVDSELGSQAGRLAQVVVNRPAPLDHRILRSMAAARHSQLPRSALEPWRIRVQNR